MEEKIAPEVGFGSLPGRRWFVSRNPGLVMEVVPERYPDRDGNRSKFIRIAFKSEAKSELHIGDGYLGSRNKLGTDTNANRQYGLFAITDPGIEPKGGFQDDGDDVHEEMRRTAEEKKEDAHVIKHIRKTYMYRHTPQDNQYRVTGRLIELNWDPAEIREYVGGIVIPGMGKPMARPPLAGSPEDPRGEKGGAKTPQMGRVPVSRRVVPS